MGVFAIKILNNLEKNIEQKIFDNYEAHYLSFKAEAKDQNQDGLLLVGYDNQLYLQVVTDGMGGHQGGEKAAEITLSVIEKRFDKKSCFQSLEIIRMHLISALFEADKQVKDLKLGAGATVVASFSVDNKTQIINSGDAKGYVLGSKGKIKLETVEHSPAGYYKEAKGEVSENIEDNIISNGIGFTPMSLEISQELETSTHDIVLLCSDGLFHIYPAQAVPSWGSTGKFESRTKDLLSYIDEKGADHTLYDDTTLILSRFI